MGAHLISDLHCPLLAAKHMCPVNMMLRCQRNTSLITPYACRVGDVEEEDGSPPLMESALPFDRQAKQLFPVSITWQPPFTMLLDLKGRGDLQACLTASNVMQMQLSLCLVCLP